MNWQRKVASHNIRSLEWLWDKLNDYADRCGRDNVAQEMGISREELDKMLSVEVDPSMSDFEELLIALGLELGFNLTNRRPKEGEDDE